MSGILPISWKTVQINMTGHVFKRQSNSAWSNTSGIWFGSDGSVDCVPMVIHSLKLLSLTYNHTEYDNKVL